MRASYVARQMFSRSIEPYRLDLLLGEGALASVYRATHTQLGSRHALKVLKVSTERGRQVLLHEGRCQSRVRHPNVLSVTDILSNGDRTALVLEYVDGPSLADWLARSSLGVHGALLLFFGIVRGLEAIHAERLVHGDLKPANVLLSTTPEGLVPKISDFGLVRDLHARPAHPDPDAGTPGYAAPEILRGEPFDERADIFSLGCIFYEMVTGEQPFRGDPIEASRASCTGSYRPPKELVSDLPDWVGALIRRLLEVDPRRRLSCSEILDSLAELDELHGRTLSRSFAPVTIEPEPVLGSQPRSPLLWLAPLAGALAGLCLLLVALPWLLSLARGVPRAPDVVAAEPSERIEAPVLPEAPVPPEPPEPPALAEPLGAPAPAPKPQAAPPAMGRIEVEGDGEVALTNAAGLHAAPGPLPSGKWRWSSRFGPREGPTGEILLAPDQTIVLRCSSFAMRCLVITK